jgi:biopolymer transport protein ExbD
MVGPHLRSESRWFAFSAFASVAALGVACTGRAPTPAVDAKYLTVFVSGDGVIQADGQEVSLSRLQDELEAAKASKAVILFAREPSERGRAAHAMLVLREVQARDLKIRFCKQRDCSDAIAPDGTLRPEP